MALTAAQLDSIFQNVLFRPAEPAAIAFYANRTDVSDAQIRQQIELSQEAVVFTNPVVRLFEAAFNRLPTQADLRFYGQELKAGFTTEQVASQLASSAEFAARVPGGTVTAAFVTSLYQDLLNRAPSAAEVTYYTARSAAQVLNGLANSPEATQAQAAAVITFVDSAAVGSPSTGDLDAQAGPSAGGTTLVLTTGLDNLVGTSAPDAIVGTVGAGTTSTLNAGDSINGGAGVDKLTIFTDQTTIPGGTTITNVEQIFIQNTDVVSTSALQFAGATQLWAQANTASLTYTDVSVAQTAGIKGNVSGATVFTYSDAGGTADTASLALDAAKITGGVTTTVTGIETLNVSGVGTGLNLVDADLKTLNVSATGTTSITANTGTALTTINAGTSTGNVTVTATNAAALAFTGGTGNDKLALGGTLTNADVINGGTGTDTVSISGGDFRTAGGDVIKGINALTSIETLEFTGATAAQVNGDTFTNAAVTKLVFNTTGASNDVIELAGARQYAVGALNETGGSLTISQRAGSTTLNLSIEGADADNGAAAEVGTVTSNGATTINLSSTGVAGQPANTAGGLTAASNTTVNLTGSQDLSIGATTILGAPGLDAAGVNYAGGSFTGKLTVTGSGSIDTIVVGTGGSTVAGGAGADIVTAGTGTDLFQFSGTTAANTSGTNFGQADVINGFTVGTDKLQITNAVEVVSVQQAGVQTAVTALAAGSTDAQIATAMATANTTTAGLSVATFNGNTYALYEAAGASTGVAANDVFIKLVGVASGVTFANSFVAE